MAQTVKNLIYQYFKKLGLEQKFLENMAMYHWSKVVGEAIALHTKPIRVESGTAFIKVDNDVWRQELQFLKKDIIEKLNQAIGKKVIQEIKFF